jgi:alcohol dehydrogenase
VVNGATGGLGSAGVAVALVMGAAKVVATGRNGRPLDDDLGRRFGPRVRPASVTGVEADDRRRIGELVGGPIDCVLDLLLRTASGSQVRAAVLRPDRSGAA